jgi:hypothetical protein
MVRRFPDSIFGQGCSIRGAPGDFSTESFIIPGMAVGTPHPIRTAFSVSVSLNPDGELPAGGADPLRMKVCSPPRRLVGILFSLTY